jgi:hypothetical protein
MSWFAIDHSPPRVVYEDAETGEYMGSSEIAGHLNEIRLEGFNPICVVCDVGDNYIVLTDSEWYFKVFPGETRHRREIPFEFDGAIPVTAYPQLERDMAILELSDGRYTVLAFFDDGGDEGWVECAKEIPAQ